MLPLPRRSHPALADAETWLQVQSVLAAHNTAGEKDGRHPHYLKGSIWCGQCGAARVDAVAAGVEEYYRGHQLDPDLANHIRTSVLGELAVKREQADADKERGAQRLAALTHERKAVLQAHYARAMPLDLLKEEMERLTWEMAKVERVTRDASKTFYELDQTLCNALTGRQHLPPAIPGGATAHPNGLALRPILGVLARRLRR